VPLHHTVVNFNIVNDYTVKRLHNYGVSTNTFNNKNNNNVQVANLQGGQSKEIIIKLTYKIQFWTNEHFRVYKITGKIANLTLPVNYR